MQHVSITILLLVSTCQRLAADIAEGLMNRLSLDFGFTLIIFLVVVSGSMALLLKFIVNVFILQRHDIDPGFLLASWADWYIDRVCRNNAYLMVRSVGFAVIFCVAVGFLMVREAVVANSGPRVVGDTVALAEQDLGRD